MNNFDDALKRIDEELKNNKELYLKSPEERIKICLQGIADNMNKMNQVLDKMLDQILERLLTAKESK